MFGGFDLSNRETSFAAGRVEPCPYVFMDFVFPTDRRERRNRNDYTFFMFGGFDPSTPHRMTPYLQPIPWAG